MIKHWKKLSLVIVLIGVAFVLFYNREQEPKYCKYVDKVSDKFIHYTKNKYGLHCWGGGGSFMDDVKLVSLAFRKDEEVDLYEARVMLVNCVQEFQNRINKDEKVRQYLHRFPFTDRDIKIKLSFKYPNDCTDQQKVAHVFNMNGEIIYSINDNENDVYKTFHKEPYSEALRIVREAGRLSLSGETESKTQ